MSELKIKGVTIVETFAEAFPMVGTRIVITAPSLEWARAPPAWIEKAKMEPRRCGYARLARRNLSLACALCLSGKGFH